MARMLTPDEMADRLAVPVATLYRWRYSGGGPPSVRIGKYLRYDPTAVEAWIKEQSANTRRTA